MFFYISPLYLNCQSRWKGESFHFMITYLHSNGVYQKDTDKQIVADGQDKDAATCDRVLSP